MKGFISTAIFSIFFLSCADDEATLNFPDAPANPDKAKILFLINEARSLSQTCDDLILQNVSPVSWNNTLQLVAEKHSKDMDGAKRLNHRGTDGSFLEERLEREGYIAVVWAENLARGIETEEAVIEGWMNSPGHCENIMNPEVLEIGVGTSGSFWTMVLATKE